MPSRKDYARFFKEADTDNSGSLSMDELVKAVRKAGFRGPDSQLKGMFHTADGSGDGVLTLDEFMVCMGEQPEKEQTTSSMRYIFNSFDKDGNGTIDRSEIKAIWAEMKKVLTEEEVSKVMSWMDKDGDGSINYEEFLQYYQSS